MYTIAQCVVSGLLCLTYAVGLKAGSTVSLIVIGQRVTCMSSEYSIKTENKVEVYFLVDQASGGYDGYNGNYYYHRIMQAGSPQCPSLTNTYGTTYPAIATDCMRVYPIYSNGMPYQPVSQVMYDP